MINPQFHNIRRATILAILSAIFCALMILFVKIAAKTASNNVIILFRFTISFIYISIIFGIRRVRHQPIPIKTKFFGLHMFRSGSALLGILIFYYAVAYIPLLDATLLFTTYPLFVPILAAVFMNIRTPKSVWFAIAIGFVGVAFVLQPGMDVFKHPMALLALLSGFFIAISSLALRTSCKKDHPYTIMFYYFTLAIVVSGGLSIFNWKTPSLHTLMILVLVGITGTFYQEFIIRAVKYAPARIVTSIMYLTVAISGVFDWLVWKNIPNLYCIFGILLVLTGAILTVIFASKKDLYEKIRT